MGRVILVMLVMAVMAVSSRLPAQQTGPMTKQTGMLGIQMHTLSKAEAEKAGLDRPTGVWVDSVNEGGPAHTAGIKPGDVILSADGVAIEGYDHFRAVVGTKGAGTEVTFQLLRQGQSTTSKAMLAPVSQALQEEDQLRALAQQMLTLYSQGKYSDAAGVAERELAIKERRFGPNHPVVAKTLNDLGYVYWKQLRYEVALVAFERGLAIREAALGREHQDVAESLIGLGIIHEDQARYVDALNAYARALTIVENALGKEHPHVAGILNNLGGVQKTLGQYDLAVGNFERALTIREKALGPQHSLVADTLSSLGLAHWKQGRNEAALEDFKRAREIKEKAFGSDHLEVAKVLNNTGLVYESQGRYDDALGAYSKALAIKEKALGGEHPDVATTLTNLSVVYSDQGRYDDALKGYNRALAIREKVLGPEHPFVADNLMGLGIVYDELHRYEAARKTYERALAILEKVVGRDHPDVGSLLNNLGNVYSGQGRNEAALEAYARALAIKEKVFGPEHPDVAKALNNLADVYDDEGNYEEAIKAHSRALAIREKILGAEHPDVAQTLNNLGVVYKNKGQLGDALQAHTRALAIREKMLGPDHPEVAGSLNNLGILFVIRGDLAQAEDCWRRSSSIIERQIALGEAAISREATNREKSKASRDAIHFQGLLKTAFRRAASGGARESRAARTSFVKVQWALASEAAAALAKMAARTVTGDIKLAALVRERQDLVAEWQRRDAALTAAVSNPPKNRDKQSESANAARLRGIETRISDVDEQLKVEFPDYAALAKPAPLTIEELQKDLRDDEALIQLFDTDAGFKPLPEETFAWIVTKTEVQWVRSELGTKALRERVAALRCGLDRAGEWVWSEEKYRWLARKPACDALRPEGLAIREPLPFNPAIAHELYEKLFGDVRKLIRGKHLLIVASGALTSLPFQVLVTKPPVPGKDYRSLAWLSREHALSVLPSVASLKALRRNAKSSLAAEPFVGFGNPVLAGRCDPVSIPKACPDEGNEQTEAQAVAARSAGLLEAAPEYFRDGLADVAALRQACPLPDTAHELRCVARSLGAPPSSLVLGKDMTETAVKKMPLGHYRVVHFATHGLLAGETERFTKTRAEPALLFTPPDHATEEDDGLLTASEIAGLKLDADWVVMSACNTAGGEKPGAEALSGLAKAFFYAGARALLVSHWPVNTNAATLMTSRTFAELRRNKSIGRSEAFRRAMLALIDDKQRPWAAHPSVWAPFVVVGEGGVAR